MRKHFKNFLFILTINLLILLFLEGLSRIFFPSTGKYFKETKDNEGKIWTQYRLGPLKPKFLKKKAPGTFRIFTFGGSTTLGFPYIPRSSFPKMLELALQRALPDKKIEVFNLALNGMNSLEIRRCLFESLNYSPDLVIIYSGHNEFFQASLIPDWRYPRLNRILEFFRRHSRLYQFLARADFFITLIPSAVGTHQELIEKIGLDFENLPMENRPMSAGYYQDRIKGYQYHLEQILTHLEAKKVPVIICTVAVNLKDWPPEWLPYPKELSEEQWENLKQILHQTEEELAENKLTAAEENLFQAKKIAPDYAMFHFLKGWLEEKRGNYQEARSEFLLAREKDNSRHRAPPEINQIIRRLSQKHRAILVDIEKFFDESSESVPGFDRFVDHVHPNLAGQYLIAQRLYETILSIRLFPLPQIPLEFPPLTEFKNTFQLDDDFLTEIDLKLATYYLLQRHLPEKDRHLIYLLERIILHKPNDLYARFCLALVLLYHTQESRAIKVLEDTFKQANGILPVQKMLERYFFPKILMQGNFLLVHLNLDPILPLFRGIMILRPEPEQTRTSTRISLKDYQWFFQYFPERNEIKNITEIVKEVIKHQQTFCSSKKFQTVDVNNYFLINPRSFFALDALLYSQGKLLVMDMLGKDPRVLIPLKLSPRQTHQLQMEIAIKPGNKEQTQTEFNLYWSSTDPPVFSEDKKISFPLKASDKFQQLTINLSQNLNWLSSQETLFLRIDPATFPGKARIRNFKIILCPPESVEGP